MNGRIKAAVLGMAALALLVGQTARGSRADEKDAHAEHFTQCAKACAKCMRECESCAHHCANLVAEGKKDHLKTLGTCADCAEFCAAAAKIVSHHGPMAVLSCEACAKACDTCGTACEKHPDDEHMKRCARECRDCAKACREMVQQVGHASTGEGAGGK
jgi:triphosphoribosyl-dephospho-CoA synthetase